MTESYFNLECLSIRGLNSEYSDYLNFLVYFTIVYAVLALKGYLLVIYNIYDFL